MHKKLIERLTRSELTLWKLRVFIGTWLAYFGLYFCRKNYTIAQPEFMKEFGWNEMQVGTIVSAYLIVYAIGQFSNGILGDKWSGRLILGTGLIASAFVNFIFGFSYTISFMFILYTLNGYFQSVGWPITIKTMTNWIPMQSRGRVMPWWGTCYQIGDIASTAFSGFVLGLTTETAITMSNGNIIKYFNWRFAFWAPALVLLVISGIVIFLVRNKPEDVNLSIDRGDDEKNNDPKLHSQSVISKTIEVLKNRDILMLGAAYFGIKFIRYTFWFWIPTYMVKVLGYKADNTAYILTLFPIAGFLGTLSGGYISDRFFGCRRAPICAIMFLGLALSLGLFILSSHSLLLMMISTGLCGFMLYGPDFLVSGISVMDFGSKEHAATAAGFVNGVGAVGAALTGIIAGTMANLWGWNSVFYLMVGFALLCAILISTMWNAVGKN